MSHSKLKVQFHPRKLSSSGSKQKYSPYRIKQKKHQNQAVSTQNKQRLQITQPLIKFRKLMDPNTSKKTLKITNNMQKMLPDDILQLTATKQYRSNPTCSNCLHLISKIDEQTQLLKENLKEISRCSKLPRIGQIQEDHLKQQNDQYRHNQQIIMNYLEELRNQRQELFEFQKQNHQYEIYIASLQETISQWQQSYRNIQRQLNACKLSLYENQNAEKYNKLCKDVNTSTKSFEQLSSIIKESTKDNRKTENQGQMKLMLAQMVTKQSSDFLKIMNELQQIKLQNQMLREQINLLNYALNEKETKIQNLKSQLSNFMNNCQKGQKQTQIKKRKKILKESIQKISNKQHQKSVTLSIDLGQNSNRIKRQNSLTIKQKSRLSFDNINLDCKQQNKMTKTISFSLVKKEEENEESKQPSVAIPHSLMKIKKQESSISKYQKQQLKKQKKQLQYFSESNMQKLDLVRRTLNHYFTGFKHSFEQVQAAILQRQYPMINFYQIDSLLSQHPFSLCKRIKSLALQYIMKQNDEKSTKEASISCDLFCNRLRQLIPDIDQVDEEEQLVLMENIKKKIYMCQQEMIRQCQQSCDWQGYISEKEMREILVELKLSEPQINTIISQCCLLSSDADHLNFKSYLSIFKNDE